MKYQLSFRNAKKIIYEIRNGEWVAPVEKESWKVYSILKGDAKIWVCNGRSYLRLYTGCPLDGPSIHIPFLIKVYLWFFVSRFVKKEIKRFKKNNEKSDYQKVMELIK